MRRPRIAADDTISPLMLRPPYRAADGSSERTKGDEVRRGRPLSATEPVEHLLHDRGAKQVEAGDEQADLDHRAGVEMG